MSSPTKRRSTQCGKDFKVQVALRIRPPGQSDSNSEDCCSVQENEVVLSPPVSMPKRDTRKFLFDKSFDPSSPQDEIYFDFGRNLVEHAIEGYNACIFAYGQTGSGKTHTMMGTEQYPGLVFNICNDLFEWAQDIEATTAVTIRMSMLEVYNEQIRDLLLPTAKIKLRTVGTDCIIEGLSEYKVSNVDQITTLLAKGNKCRATAATKMNDQSSRSHAVISLSIKQQHIQSLDSRTTQEKVSLFRLVDLAGSERAGMTGATGDRLKEGKNINQSLVILGRVISTLADLAERPNSMTLVPYRESILTRLLQPSLSGNSRTAMIACVSPDQKNYEQTLSTLRYADQAKKITTKAKINQDVVSSEAHKERLQVMERELSELKQQLTNAKSHETESANEENLLTGLVQFYEDEMARQEVRSRMLQAQRDDIDKQNLALSDFVREVIGQGLSSVDSVSNHISFEDLMTEKQKIQDEVAKGIFETRKRVQRWTQFADVM